MTKLVEKLGVEGLDYSLRKNDNEERCYEEREDCFLLCLIEVLRLLRSLRSPLARCATWWWQNNFRLNAS